MNTFRHLILLMTAVAIIAAGCSSMNRTKKGAVIGAAGGGAIGGIIGRTMGNTAMGAIIGAAVGGTVGAVIGRKMDKQAEEMKKVLGDAEVKRVGEGIVIEFKDKVLFGYDRSDLTSPAQASLNKLVTILQKYPDTNIQVIGHTDDRGSDEYNQGLSERRATSSASYLRSQGVSDTRITTKGMGESDPKVSNDSDATRTENRRVEFVITANQKMIEDAKRESNN